MPKRKTAKASKKKPIEQYEHKDKRHVKWALGSDDYLYHCTTADGVLGIIGSSSFWATKHNFMNDPMELRHVDEMVLNFVAQVGYDVKKKEYRDRFGSERFLEEGPSRITDSVRKTIQDYLNAPDSEWPYEKDHCFIISFATVGDALSLWERYANTGGFILAFRKRDILADLRGSVREMKRGLRLRVFHSRVKYKDSYDQLRQIVEGPVLRMMGKLRSVAEASYTGAAEIELLNATVDALRSLHKYRIFIKTSAFKDEREFRFAVICTDSAIQKGVIGSRSRGGMLIPYLPLRLKSLGALDKIIISPLIKEPNCADGLRLFLKSKNLSNVRVVESSVQYRK